MLLAINSMPMETRMLPILNKIKFSHGIIAISALCGAIYFQDLSQASSAEEITYDVTFESLWDANDHAGFPDTAHFSPILTVSHNADYRLFGIGEMATRGLEQLAETGKLSRINSELSSAEEEGSLGSMTETEDLYPDRDGPTLSFPITVTEDHSLVSLATMIAPSPDWFVGIDSLDLRAGDTFVEEVTLDLYAINAGTEDGDEEGNYSIDNPATDPQEAISTLTGAEGYDTPFARVTFRKN